MILGVGLDVVDVAAFRALLQPTVAGRQAAFVDATFTAREQARAHAGAAGSDIHLAGAFAAKEAALKALDAACGFLALEPPTVALLDVELAHDARGRPALSFREGAHALAEALEVSRCHVSISHDGPVATAVVMLERSR